MNKLKFMFDWGSGVCLWSTNKAAEEKFGDYPVTTDDLPISRGLKEKLKQLTEKHDEAFNWSDPAGDLLWDDAQIQEFLVEAKNGWQLLCDELGNDYKIEFWNQM